MPNQAIIDSFKGVLDFYYWNGIPCVRKWPVHKPRIPSDRELAARQTFADAAHMWNQLPPFIKAWYNRMAAGVRATGRDIFMRGYLGGTKH